MASEQRVADYAVDQMRGAGAVRSRKMFGEYAIYCNERVVALVCDNELFFRPTEAGRRFIGTVTEGPPYPGAKLHFQVTERLDDRDWLTELTAITAAELPAPKPKKPKKAKAAGKTTPGLATPPRKAASRGKPGKKAARRRA
ncbi:MAG: TfoX/Sxy family protein [Gemmatimonadales bacterium]